MTYTKPANLFASSVIEAPNTGDATIALGKVNITGITGGIRFSDIKAVKKTVYAAGTLQKNTFDFTSITAADSTEYTITILLGNASDTTLSAVTTKVFTPSTGTTTSSIKTQFVAAFNANAAALVNAVSTGAQTLTIEEKTLETKGFIVTAFPAGMTNTATTPGVRPSGTPDEVSIYSSTATGTYDKWEFDVVHWRNVGANYGGTAAYLVKYIVWAHLGGTLANFTTAINNIVTAGNLADAAAKPYFALI